MFVFQALLLLNNLTQYNQKNQQTIMQLMVPKSERGNEKLPAFKALIDYFYQCERTAM